jgi:hypothetical protein
MTNAACLKSTAQTLSFSAVKSRPASFKMAVRPPTKALNDAARRRVVDAVFEQDGPGFRPADRRRRIRRRPPEMTAQSIRFMPSRKRRPFAT